MADLELGRHTIGFVLPERDRARSLGSGTLIRFGGLEGILTAAHVLDEVKKFDEIGLLTFPVRSNQPQRIRLQVKHAEWIKIGKEPYSERGPDLAFVKLPSKDHRRFESEPLVRQFSKTIGACIC
jgi:hypothetical protein